MCRNRPLAARAGKAQSTPPKGTSRQVSNRVGAPSRRPKAARTRSSGRVQAVPISAAASSTARVDLSVAMGGFGTGAGSAADSPGTTRLGSVAVGGFGTGAGSAAGSPGTTRLGSVAVGGFGTGGGSAADSPGTTRLGSVAVGGFGTGAGSAAA